MHELSMYGIVYLGTPYTKYEQGIEIAFRDAAVVTARLLRAGVNVYSPIVHTHPIAIYGGINPKDHAIWIPFDEAMMKKSDALVVACLPGWQDSYGIAMEIMHFMKDDKQVWFMNPVTLQVVSSEQFRRIDQTSWEMSFDVIALENYLGLTS